MELVGAGKPASAVLGSSDVCMFGFRLVFSLLGPFGSFGCLVACSLFDLCVFFWSPAVPLLVIRLSRTIAASRGGVCSGTDCKRELDSSFPEFPSVGLRTVLAVQPATCSPAEVVAVSRGSVDVSTASFLLCCSPLLAVYITTYSQV